MAEAITQFAWSWSESFQSVHRHVFLEGMSVDDLAELYETTMSDLLDKTYRLSRYVISSVRWLLGSMPNGANLGDIQECSRGDTDERDLTPTGWHGYSNSRKCVRCMKKRTINRNYDCWQQRQHEKTLADTRVLLGRRRPKRKTTATTWRTSSPATVEAVRLSTSPVSLQDIPYTAT